MAQNIISVWRLFSNEVIERLLEKDEEGYTGWDGEYPTEELLTELTDDALLLERGYGYKQTYLDIAARAMMLWHRQEH